MSISSPRHHAYFNKRIMLHWEKEKNWEMQRCRGNCCAEQKDWVEYHIGSCICYPEDANLNKEGVSEAGGHCAALGTCRNRQTCLC